jgi:hypothetical protein
MDRLIPSSDVIAGINAVLSIPSINPRTDVEEDEDFIVSIFIAE